MDIAIRIVTQERGSWRWQNAYRIAEYVPHFCRAGHWVWRLNRYLTKKSSMPQLLRMGYEGTPMGGLHHQPMTPKDGWTQQ